MTNADTPENANKRDSSSHEESDGDRLRGIVSSIALSVDLVSVLAGDRTPTEDEKSFLSSMKNRRGQRFFSDMLYAITHQYFAPEIAEEMWTRILKHKYETSKTLHRNVGIVVAALDYLSNLKPDIHFPTLIGESHIFKIVELSMHDGLTGLFNHTTCHEIMSVELNNYARYGTSLSLILLDIDDFKLVNDQSGHLEGDRVLRELASSLKKETRNTDICCRYGGDEFAVLLPYTNIKLATEIADRIRLAVKEIHFRDRTLTVSIGVASCNAEMTSSKELVDKADQALYRAKKDGKNCVRTEA